MAAIKPAGPAPTMRQSTSEVGGGAMAVDSRVLPTRFFGMVFYEGKDIAGILDLVVHNIGRADQNEATERST